MNSFVIIGFCCYASKIRLNNFSSRLAGTNGEQDLSDFDSNIHQLPKNRPLKLAGLRDQLFAGRAYPHPFRFNAEVAKVFDDMVVRSIPLYAETIRMLCEWAMRAYQRNTRIYDLGCSTGTTLMAINEVIADEGAQLVGVDNSDPMIAVAQAKLKEAESTQRVQFECGDITEIEIRNASFVVMNYTLQFIPVMRRQQLLSSIVSGMLPGGCFFISEKLRSTDPETQEIKTSIYESFKFSNGYSDDEISRKKAALDQVLVPFSYDEHIDHLKNAGFRIVEPVLLWNNFASFVAIK